MDCMLKRDLFYSFGSVFGLLSCVLKVIELLGKEGLANHAIIAIFILLTTFVIIVIGWFFIVMNKVTIDSLTNANKTIQENMNQLIQSQNQHIKNQEDRFQRPSIQSSSDNN